MFRQRKLKQSQMQNASGVQSGKMLPAERIRMFRQEASKAIESGNQVAGRFSSLLKVSKVLF